MLDSISTHLLLVLLSVYEVRAFRAAQFSLCHFLVFSAFTQFSVKSMDMLWFIAENSHHMDQAIRNHPRARASLNYGRNGIHQS